MDLKVRENLDGEYLIIDVDEFEESIEYAAKIKVGQIQLRNISSQKYIADFGHLEKVSEHLKVLSFVGTTEDIINFESIYSLINIEKIYFQEKQKFNINISRFSKIVHLGSEYWKGLYFEQAASLKSIVLFKYPFADLKPFSSLKVLKTLHIYRSKIETMEGIESLPIQDLALVKNNSLTDINAILSLYYLRKLHIDKCKGILDYSIFNSIKNGVEIDIIK